MSDMDMMSDAAMLLSFVNMKLRGGCDLEELCSDLDWDRAELEERLGAAGYRYDAQNRCFR